MVNYTSAALKKSIGSESKDSMSYALISLFDVKRVSKQPCLNLFSLARRAKRSKFLAEIPEPETPDFSISAFSAFWKPEPNPPETYTKVFNGNIII